MKFEIDMRSDTVTLPPDGMRRAIAEAELGDDFYHDDPTVKRLEAKSAEMLGKEAALLVLSGTMGNLVSVMTQARPGTEAIVEQDAHIFKNEGGGMARVAGVMPKRIPGVMGVLDPAYVESQMGAPTVLNHGTSLICVEQTHNGASGTALPLENLSALKKVAGKFGAKLHMDGARLFNAAVALGVPASKVVEDTDSVTFCLSKGLCCPLGAVVAGSRAFIEQARFNRQSLGGGMRQAGVIAAAGIWALDNMVERLIDDHNNAKRLAVILAECGFEVNLESVQSNIVRFKTAPLTSDEFKAKLNAEGIDVLPAGKYGARFVTHWPVSAADIERTGKVIRAMSHKH